MHSTYHKESDMRNAMLLALFLFFAPAAVVSAVDEPPTTAPPAAVALQPAPASAPAQSTAAMKSAPEKVAVRTTLPKYLAAASEQVGRGASNVFYSILELPVRIGKEMERTNPIGGFITGILKGAGWCGLRATVGVLELGTFLFPTKSPIPDFEAGWLTA
jgi:putative exosortase-associated protein (TIGR04073 family)